MAVVKIYITQYAQYMFNDYSPTVEIIFVPLSFL